MNIHAARIPSRSYNSEAHLLSRVVWRSDLIGEGGNTNEFEKEAFYNLI